MNILINEVEQIIQYSEDNFEQFNSNFMAVRAAERDLELVGEIIGKVNKFYPEIKIHSSEDIIGLRNILAHAYDVIDPAILWGIMLDDIPILKLELKKVKQ